MEAQLFSQSSSVLRGYEDLVECPYNRAHQIMQFRMQTHLTKCRKNYKDLKYVKCPFNETHDIPQKELALHVESCVDRESFDRYKFCVATSAATIVPEVASSVDESLDNRIMGNPAEEMWDEGPMVRAYNPQAYAARSNVIRKCTGMAPSQKKAFKEAERQRLAELKRRCEIKTEQK
ncbi:gametocyte-specific factor 1 homolog [Aedes albopictus]|uniref:CHHC U11-48K-type domain-containing protein n=1 Tax=Aedes albopictus TaxID=7160 RepID=A0A023EGY4_AEDAL|nr:gametocyte-specific factor 1 homolog [Aedes albopictus]XP_029723168.1 gametocyte-specific factor 1 homolog [Aedes albopictus]XP_029728501.1 gametocyte-specific factor 1 homolog [Aedes albopictus]